MEEHRRLDDDVLALKTFVKLVRAAETVSTRVHGDLLRAGLTTSQFGVLEALFHLGPQCQKDIAEKILRSTGNITMVIDNLEKRGLVLRRRKEGDRRSYMVELTEKGKALIAELFPAHARRISQVMSVLGREELEQLGTILRKFRFTG